MTLPSLKRSSLHWHWRGSYRHLPGEGLIFTGRYKLAAVACDFIPESLSACRSTTFSSFSLEENRCRISCMRTDMLRMVSICERATAENDPDSSSSNSEFPSTDVSALFKVWRISST